MAPIEPFGKIPGIQTAQVVLSWISEQDFSSPKSETAAGTDEIATNLGPDSVSTQYDYGSVNEGLVAYYPMEEGQGQVLHDGALDNIGQIDGPSWNGSGQVGSDSLTFNGSSDGVIVDNSDGRFSTEPVTVSCWAKRNAYDGTGTNEGLVTVSYDGTDSPWQLWWDSTQGNDIAFRVGDGTNNANAEKNDSFPTGQWFHLVGVYDRSNTEARLYIDGILEDTAQFSGTTLYDSTNDVNIGKNEGFTNYFDGEIDDVRIYDRVLSEQEILELANSPRTTGFEVTEFDVPTQTDSGVSRYEFENDVTDSWGTNDGTDNTSAGFVDGVYGQAKDFDGTDDFVRIGDLQISPLTVACWFNTNDNTIRQGVVNKYEGVAGERQWTIQLIDLNSSGTIQPRFIVEDGTNNALPEGGDIPQGEWIHVCGTYDESVARLYVDGKLVDSDGSASGPIQDGTIPIDIGTGNSDGFPFNGSIDDVRLYNKALSPTEVESLYNKGAYRISRGDVL